MYTDREKGADRDRVPALFFNQKALRLAELKTGEPRGSVRLGKKADLPKNKQIVIFSPPGKELYSKMDMALFDAILTK